MTIKLLLIDDSITIHRVVKQILGEDRFTVISVDNSEEGARLIRIEKPDIILCDVSMEGIDGYKICEIVRSDHELKNVPVILLAEVFEPLDTERVSAVNASGHIIKPFEPEELINKIESFIGCYKQDLKAKTGTAVYDIEEIKDTEALENAVRKILDETMKDTIEKTLKEMLQTSLLPLLKDSIDKVLWEVLPDTAEMLISKEIERLRAGE